MRTVKTTLILVVLALLPVVAYAAEETGEAAESAIGISNLIIIVGLGAVLVVGLVRAASHNSGESDS
ncbi:MAG: hypothetical protein AAF125_26335 [Chloroflexota bacterium]